MSVSLCSAYHQVSEFDQNTLAANSVCRRKFC